MLMRHALACCLLLLVPGFVIADDQEAANAGDEQAEAGKSEFDDLFGGGGGADGKEPAGDDGLARDLVNKITSIQESMEEMKRLNKTVLSNMTRIGEVEQSVVALSAKVDELTNQLAEQKTQQGQLLETIQDGSGNTILPLTAIMDKSPAFAQQMTDAVHRVIKQEGLLTIDNKTNTYRSIHVNRTQFGVKAGESVTLKVPTGTVATQIEGEELKTWMIAAPSYSQKIEIVPTQTRTTTLRPTVAQPTTAYYPSSNLQTVTASSAPTTQVYSIPTTTYRVPVYYYYGY